LIVIKLCKSIFGRDCLVGFQAVSEVCQEPDACLKFNVQGLVVQSEPFAIHPVSCVTINTLLIATFTFLSLHVKPILNLNFPNIFFVKLEFEIFVYDLYFVWKVMCANFVHLKQINSLCFLRYMKVPETDW
jgi:hypothetical protein